MLIEITRGTVCNGRPVEPGEVLDVDEREAALLIHLGKAKVASEIRKSTKTMAKAVVSAKENTMRE